MQCCQVPLGGNRTVHPSSFYRLVLVGVAGGAGATAGATAGAYPCCLGAHLETEHHTHTSTHVYLSAL